MELAEDLSDLVRMKVFEDAEVVHAVERARFERQVEDARLLDPTGARVVTRIERQRPLGDVDGGHAKPFVKARVHLAAAASSVEEPRASGERPLGESPQVVAHHQPIHDGDEVVDRPERRSLLAPVLVPALRLRELRTQPVDRAGSCETAGVRQVREEQPQQEAPAPEALTGRELGAPVHPRRKHDRNLADASAVTTQDEEAFEEERVGAGRHELEELTRNAPQIVEPEGSARIVRHAQEHPRQEMPEPCQEQAVQTPAGEAVRPEVARGHDHVYAVGVRGQQAGKVGRAVRKVGVQRDEEVIPLVVGVGDAGTMRAADAELASSMDHRDPTVLAREPVERRAGAVGRAIVDEENVRVQWESLELRAEPLDVAVLVVGRHEDEQAGRHHRRDDETTSIEGSGNISFPPAARYAASRSMRPARKCHGNTRK